MGLGPPVCDNCEVIPQYNDLKQEWACPICDSTTFVRHSQLVIDYKKYEDTLKFLKFVKGETDGNI